MTMPGGIAGFFVGEDEDAVFSAVMDEVRLENGLENGTECVRPLR